MTQTLSIQQATHPAREFVLPGGGAVVIRQLLLRDWQGMMRVFSRFVETLAILHDGEITDDAVRDGMPAVLADCWASGGRAEVLELLRLFCDIDEVALDAATMADFTALWEAIYAENRRPFTFRRAEMARLGIFAALKAIDWPSVISSPCSTAPESTPAPAG